MALVRRFGFLGLALAASIPALVWTVVPFRPATMRREARARVTRRLLARVGGIFPKLGQFASTRVDIVPAHYRGELALLRSGCLSEPACAFASALAPLSDRLSGLEPDPVGVGAIAQVYRARSAYSGEPLAVKAIKPRAARDWSMDLRIARWTCRALDPLTRRFGLSLRDGFADLQAALEAHRDLRDEADAMQYVARACAENGLRVRIPTPVFPAARDLLVTDFVVAEQADSLGIAPEVARQAVLDAMALLFRMIFDIGVVHCDLHPGNLLVDRDGQLVVLDFGGCRRLSSQTRTAFRALFASIGTRDGARASALFLGMALPYHGAKGVPDAERFNADVQALMDEVHSKNVSNFRVARFVEGVFRVHRRHGLVAGADFVAIILALLVFEGTALRLAPEADFQRMALEILMDPWSSAGQK